MSLEWRYDTPTQLVTKCRTYAVTCFNYKGKDVFRGFRLDKGTEFRGNDLIHGPCDSQKKCIEACERDHDARQTGDKRSGSAA